MKTTYGVDVRVVCTGEGLQRKVCVPAMKGSARSQ